MLFVSDFQERFDKNKQVEVTLVSHTNDTFFNRISILHRRPPESAHPHNEGTLRACFAVMHSGYLRSGDWAKIPSQPDSPSHVPPFQPSCHWGAVSVIDIAN
jgi:hypothetical protein